MAACYAFDRFVLDPRDRRLRDDGTPVEVNARYLDALALLVQSHGQLVSKDQFMAEVWQGIPVTDEALTQCIKTLRRLLGDNVGNPRFIQTVPKHGYRFIARVTEVNQPAKSPAGEARPKFAMTVLGGVIGGGLAGIIGGLLLGLVVTSGA